MSDSDAIKRRIIHALSIDYDCSDALYEIVMGESTPEDTDSSEDAATLADRLAKLLTAPKMPKSWPLDAEGEPVELGAEYEMDNGKATTVRQVSLTVDTLGIVANKTMVNGTVLTAVPCNELRRVKPDTWDALAEDLAGMVDKAVCGELSADELRKLADRCERMGR